MNLFKPVTKQNEEADEITLLTIIYENLWKTSLKKIKKLKKCYQSFGGSWSKTNRVKFKKEVT